jgi:hypothetical protein
VFSLSRWALCSRLPLETGTVADVALLSDRGGGLVLVCRHFCSRATGKRAFSTRAYKTGSWELRVMY